VRSARAGKRWLAGRSPCLSNAHRASLLRVRHIGGTTGLSCNGMDAFLHCRAAPAPQKQRSTARLASCTRSATRPVDQGPPARHADLPVLPRGSGGQGAPPDATYRSPRCAAVVCRAMVRAPVFARDQVRRHDRLGRPRAVALRGRTCAVPGAPEPASEGLIPARARNQRLPASRAVNRQSAPRSSARAAADRVT